MASYLIQYTTWKIIYLLLSVEMQSLHIYIIVAYKVGYFDVAHLLWIAAFLCIATCVICLQQHSHEVWAYSIAQLLRLLLLHSNLDTSHIY